MQFTDELPTINELIILKYTDKGEKKKVRIIEAAKHKWKDIASLISSDSHETSVLEDRHRGDPNECLKEAFIHSFIDKKPRDYSQDWNGLIELLDDIGLERLSKDVKHALETLMHS